MSDLSDDLTVLFIAGEDVNGGNPLFGPQPKKFILNKITCYLCPN
jgi:hypothetical protein